MSIKVGDQAPELSLYNTDKILVSLSEFKGQNVLLLFFPLAFTGVCTDELCSVRDNLSLYQKANAEVLGISVDSPFTLERYKADQQLNFSLLSDFNKVVSESYGVLYDVFPAFEMKGVSKRAAFIIDKDGIVQYEEICATPGHLPNFNEIQKVLSNLN